MKVLLILIIVSVTQASDPGPWIGGYRVKFDVGSALSTEYFVEMPRNKSQATSDGLIEATPPDGLQLPLSDYCMLCLPHGHICFIYDDTGYIAVKYGDGLEIDTEYFFNFARNVTQAKADGMIRATPPRRAEGPLSKHFQLTMYCVKGFYVCGLYDDTGYIAGVQIGLPKNDIKDTVFDFHRQGYTTWTRNINCICVEYWVTHAYFISEEKLKTCADSRIATRNPNKLLQDGGIWVTGINGSLVFISSIASQMKNTPFTKQKCIPRMGLHYFYNVTRDTQCTSSDDVFSWFYVTNCNKLVGVSFFTVGRLNIRYGCRNYFEVSNATMVEMNLIDGPPCFYELANDIGVLSIHLYIVDKPWRITCKR